jgi:Holliday junction resolvase RusA-like endonuclease
MSTATALNCRIPATPHRLCNPNAHATPKIRAELEWPLSIKPEHIIKFALRDQLREAAEMTALSIRPDDPIAGPVVLHVVIAYEKGRQTLDFDNAIASLKGAIDGIVRGGLMRNDKQVKGIHLDQIKDPDGLGYIDITVEAAEAA